MAILKHTYKVAITRTNIGYDIVINEFATDGTHREYERRHHAWALTSHGADRAAQRLISRLTLPWLKPRDSCELGLLGFRRYA